MIRILLVALFSLLTLVGSARAATFLPGAWYTDARDGHHAALIPGSHITTSRGAVGLPNGQNLLYLRCARACAKFAGVGHQDDLIWEWNGSAWLTHGAAYGVSPAIYDNFDNLHLNPGSWGSQGARYVNERNEVITADATYFSPSMELSEWTALAGDLFIGQSHPDGTNDSAWVWDRGTLRFLEGGPCRFIRATRSGDRVSIALWKPGQGAVVYDLTVAELRALPVVTSITPEEKKDEPKEDPKPQPSQKDTVERVRAKYPTPLGARHWEFLVDVAQATGAKLFRKDGGDRVHIPVLGLSVSQDIVILPATRQWVDILGDAENTATPAWAVHENAGEPEKWIDVSGIKLPGATPDPVKPPPPPPVDVAALKARIAELEKQSELANTRVRELLAAKDVADHTLAENAAEITRLKAELANRPTPTCEVRGVPGWARSFGIRASCVIVP